MIDIWGDGTQTRSFMYIDDCTYGIDRITHCDALVATPVNLGSSELIEINRLADIAEEIGGVESSSAATGWTHPREWPVATATTTSYGASSAGNRPPHSGRGLAKTYAWIEKQYNDRKAGLRTVS